MQVRDVRAQVPPFLQVPGRHANGLVVGVVEGVAEDSTTTDDVGDDASFEGAGDVAEVATGDAGTDVAMETKDDVGVNNTNDVITACEDTVEPVTHCFPPESSDTPLGHAH